MVYFVDETTDSFLSYLKFKRSDSKFFLPKIELPYGVISRIFAILINLSVLALLFVYLTDNCYCLEPILMLSREADPPYSDICLAFLNY